MIGISPLTIRSVEDVRSDSAAQLTRDGFEKIENPAEDYFPHWDFSGTTQILRIFRAKMINGVTPNAKETHGAINWALRLHVGQTPSNLSRAHLPPPPTIFLCNP